MRPGIRDAVVAVGILFFLVKCAAAAPALALEKEMTTMWRREEIDRLAKQFGIRAGIRLHEKAEDYHFPEGSFLSEGYSPPGGYVKDFSLIRKEGRLHLFHIDGRPGEVCWVTGNEISFGHASTSDGCRWIRHPMPLAVGDRPWESEHIWAPYVYRRDGRNYMFYMGSGRGETFISYATSGDLERWERWAGGPIRCAVGRDPFVFDHAGKAILLYTGHGGARVSGCASQDMIQWEPLPDLMRIPGGAAAESCSLHPIHGKYVLWFNDYGPELAGFRAAYAFSEDPLRFNPAVIREFRFVTDNPAATPSPELRVDHPVPLSIELIAAGRSLWVAAYFRWHIDRNRLFFGSIDWSSDPAIIKEINNEAELNSVLRKAGMKSLGDVEAVGLETVKPLDSGKLRIEEKDLKIAETIRSELVQRSAGLRRCEVRKKTPVFTGDLAKDFGNEIVFKKPDDAEVRSAIAWDDTFLYLGWRVADATPWANGADSPEFMYARGDTVDFQLGTDPEADENRAEAAKGDLHLSVGNFRGKPTAVLYRKIAEQKNPKTFSSGVVRNYVMDSVVVLQDAKIEVMKGDRWYVVEAVVPLSTLGLKPFAGMKLSGDFGATHGTPAGDDTLLRTHWNNQATGLVNDEVFELKMEPKNWGQILFTE